MEKFVVNNIQNSINQMQRAYAHQYAYPESVSDSDQEGDDIDISIEKIQAESADNTSDMSSD